MTFVFYDTETTGTNTSFDQILQFAAIRTDDDLNELDRFNIRCRLKPHVVPSAAALCVTGMTIPRITALDLPSHYEMVCAVRERLAGWAPVTFVGWNSMRFDEQMLRQAFYQCLHPPYLTNTNGNERCDVLKLAQCLEVFAPGVLKIPTDESGRPTFKLDKLAPANGFAHVNAHDALADVEATVFISRLIRQRAPDAWEGLLQCASKRRVIATVSDSVVFSLRESYFGRPYEFPLTMVGAELGGTGALVAYDLQVEPEQLLRLNDELLAARLSRRPKPLRRIRPNAAPIVTPVDVGEAFGDLGYDTLLSRSRIVRADKAFCDRLLKLSERESTAPSEHVEEQIYVSFASPHDRTLMEHFHSLGWVDRYPIVESFEDERFKLLGRRLIFEHCPESLPEQIRSGEALVLHRRLTGHDCDSPPWTTLETADAEAAGMQANGDSRYDDILRGFREFIAAQLAMTAKLSVA
jgi:exodeoxyribonuclease-1